MYTRRRDNFFGCTLCLSFILLPLALFTEYTVIDHAAWLLLIICGSLITLYGIETYNEARASKHWPKCEVASFKCSLDSQRGNKGLVYAPKVDCTFYIDGTRWHGTLYDFGGVYEGKREAEEKVQKINSMSSLTISYNPEDPSINVIYPGPRFTHCLRIILGPAVIALYIFYLMDWLPPVGGTGGR